MIKHLNRIYKLGYDIEVTWNKQIQITYDFNRVSGFEDYEPVSVLIYVHDFWDESLNFQKCLALKKYFEPHGINLFVNGGSGVDIGFLKDENQKFHEWKK
jgi:hypothetical protein